MTCDFALLSFNVRVCCDILSVWVEFDELYFSYLLKMLDMCVHVVDTGRVDCFGVCVPSRL